MSLDAPRCFALLPCAGSGSRAGTAQPKQYQRVAGQPLVRHTLAAFVAVARIARVLVVVAPGDGQMDDVRAPVERAPCGGGTRAESVFNGLGYLLATGARPGDWVLVHDAARCLLRPEWVDALIDACAGDAVGGLLAQPLADTLKQAGAGGRVAATVDRSGKWAAQTPQMFRLGLLRRALAAAGPGVTDEAAAVESLGLAPRLVAAPLENFKLTWPEDFELAERLLRARERLAKASQPEAAAATISAACREGTR